MNMELRLRVSCLDMWDDKSSQVPPRIKGSAGDASEGRPSSQEIVSLEMPRV